MRRRDLGIYHENHGHDYEDRDIATGKIFLNTDTKVPVVKTMVIGLVPMVNASNTMVGDADEFIEKTKLPATVDFYHGI
jgi:hypothetical protein